MQGYLLIAGETHALTIHPGMRLADGRPIALLPSERGPATGLKIGDTLHAVEIARDGERLWIHLHGRAHELVWQHTVDHHAEESGDVHDGVARAPMPGSVISVAVADGVAVAAGDALMVIESMKLETTIRAARDGVVAAIHFAVGQSFERGAPLVSVVPQG